MGPICEYCNEWRMSTIICALYAGIATNEECQRLFVPYMRILQGMQNANGYYGTDMRVLQGM